MKNNKAIIIGGDHHNTLAIMRCLGTEKIPFITVIHSNEKINKIDVAINYSKFSNNLEFVNENEEDLVNFLLNHKIEGLKQIVFPASDFSEYVLDKNSEKLNKWFYIPGFKSKPGMVAKLMDKFEQKKWADENSILMAKSWKITRKNGKFNISKDITYPCIIKPCISAKGSKSDICITNNQEELESVLFNYENKNYNEIIVQEFIKKDFEVCAIGCITPDYKIGKIIRKIRENPPSGGGSLTYAKFINDDNIENFVDIVIEKLQNDNYQGLYDIEFFVCGNKIYLNEINFRHSGNGYAMLKAGLPAPYILYLYFENADYKYFNEGKNILFIDDFNELSLYRKKYISLYTFIHDFITAKAHSIYDIKDIGVFRFKLFSIFRKKVKHEKKHG